MTEQEIKEAVENLKQCIVKNYKDTPVKFSAVNSADIHTLLTLAEEYLGLKGWPEEKCFFLRDFLRAKDYQAAKLQEKGFNEALRLCKLAALKARNRIDRNSIYTVLESQVSVRKKLTNEEEQAIIDGILELINGKEKE